MKALIFTLALLVSNGAMAGNQFSFCTSAELELSVCWSTTALYLKSKAGLEQLNWLPLELGNQAIYANMARSVLVQTANDFPYILVDGVGAKFRLQCSQVKNGTCH